MRERLLSHPLLLSHLLMPFTAFLIVAVFLEYSCVDIWLADSIYRWSGNTWRYRDAWLTAVLIHEGGRDLVGIAAAALLVMTMLSLSFSRLEPWRRILVFLVVSTLGCGLLINILKSLTHVDCPWDILRYGGSHPYVRNFHALPAFMEAGACFPAGHASAAYSWFGLYYAARILNPRLRLIVLAGVLFAGAVFGIGQQLRGAHFISHDLWTLGICWILTTLIAFLLLPPPPANRFAPA